MSLVIKLASEVRERLVSIQHFTGHTTLEATLEWLIRAEIDRQQRIEKQATQAKTEAPGRSSVRQGTERTDK